MWLFTNFGFFSVVQKPGDTDLTVRSRLRSDLEHLRERYIPALGAVAEHGGTDYQYRAKVSHAALAEAMSKIMQDISYSNFKNAVADQQGRARAQIYGEVWQALWDLKPTCGTPIPASLRARTWTRGSSQSQASLPGCRPLPIWTMLYRLQSCCKPRPQMTLSPSKPQHLFSKSVPWRVTLWHGRSFRWVVR